MKIDLTTIVRPLPDNILINEIEKSLRVKFPENFKEFLQEYNGAIPISNQFNFDNHSYTIERFLCILENSEADEINGWYDIEVVIAQIGERLIDDEDLVGTNVLPIAVLYGSDFVCLDFRESTEPCVVIWYHEESEEFTPVTKKIAENVSDFFNMLNE